VNVTHVPQASRSRFHQAGPGIWRDPRPVSDTVSPPGYARRMNLRTLLVIGILVAAAFSLSVAMITHEGVGALEWILGIVVVTGLLLLAVQKSHRTLTRS
jgi:hypothetical protein